MEQESIPSMMPPPLPPKKNKDIDGSHTLDQHEVGMAVVVAHVLPPHSSSPLPPVLPPKPMNNYVSYANT